MRSAGDGADGAEDYGDEIRLTVAGVAARLGVAAPTLRTWDRRYGLGPSEHTAGSHRRYAAGDIARLETMRRLTLEGVAPADAARIAKRGSRREDVAGTPLNQVANGHPGAGDGQDLQAPGGHGAIEEVDEATPVTDPLTLAAAAVEADTRRLDRLLRRAERAKGLLETWQMLVRPALEMVVMREHSDMPGSDPEHLLRGTLLALVRERIQSDHTEGPAVAIYPESARVLEGHVLGGELTTQGADVRVLHPRLGADGPAVVLESIRRRPGALAVLIGAPDGIEHLLQALGDAEQQTFVISVTESVPARPGLHRARTLAGSVHEIMSLITARSVNGSAS